MAPHLISICALFDLSNIIYAIFIETDGSRAWYGSELWLCYFFQIITLVVPREMFLPHPRVKVSIVGSLRDREVAFSASDRQGSNFDFCVWKTVSSQSSHHPQEVLLAQFSLYVHKGGLKPDSFHSPREIGILHVYVKYESKNTSSPLENFRYRDSLGHVNIMLFVN